MQGRIWAKTWGGNILRRCELHSIPLAHTHTSGIKIIDTHWFEVFQRLPFPTDIFDAQIITCIGCTDAVVASREAWGGISSPSWLCPQFLHYKKKMAKISYFRQFFWFLPPQKRTLPPQYPLPKNLWCLHCTDAQAQCQALSVSNENLKVNLMLHGKTATRLIITPLKLMGTNLSGTVCILAFHADKFKGELHHP